MLSNQISTEITDAMRSVFGKQLLSVVLYGSAARGENTPESDVDLALFLSAPMTPAQLDEMATWFAEAGLKHDLVFSPIDIEQSMFDKWVEAMPFYQNIRKEGVVLWKAA
ncbi:MAG: nucleotidyltransferase domain-containing protein [Oscillospiraceae bacterium]|nr:nucleotidyltransferase domain-containing protein [Oscillospiraceae bacterium]